MSITFTKLFSSITESTIWCEPSEIRIVWITMLAMADKRGRIWASIPGLANRAQITIKETEKALEKFLSPDPYSRTSDHEGRRIEPIDGGWRLLNHEKYRAMRDAEERKEYKKDWIAEKRRKDKVDNVDQGRPQYTQAEADTEADPLKTNTSEISQGNSTRNRVPFQKIVDLYHETLPELPKMVVITKAREGKMRQRWANDLTELSHWKNYFDFVRQSKFLMGDGPATRDRPPFRASLDWLIKADNYAKVTEEKYHE